MSWSFDGASQVDRPTPSRRPRCSPGRCGRRAGSPRRTGSSRSRHVAHPIALLQVDDRGAVGEVERHQQAAAVGRDRQLLRPGVWSSRRRSGPGRPEPAGLRAAGGRGWHCRKRGSPGGGVPAVDQDEVARGPRQTGLRRPPARERLCRRRRLAGARESRAMPPDAPGRAMVWITRRRAVSTMRMSLAPWPADTVHRNRPSAVTAPPVGKLPSATCAPCGVSWRPLSRKPVAGSGALGAACAGPEANAGRRATSANMRMKDSRRIVIEGRGPRPGQPAAGSSSPR